MRITLSSLGDLPLLPKPWNFEFWTKQMNEDEIGMTLVNVGEPFIPKQSIEDTQVNISEFTSRISSVEASCRTSKRNSFRLTKDGPPPKRVDNHVETEPLTDASFVTSTNPTAKLNQLDNADVISCECEETESEWEWVWEDESGNEIRLDAPEDKNANTKVSTNQSLHSEQPLKTMEQLEEVKEIIEKPEEKWRTIWRKSIDSTVPSREGAASISSVNSVFSGTSIAFNTQYQKKRDNVIQEGIDKSDPLSLVKVSSAKQWKAISKNLTINLSDIELEDEQSNPVSGEDIVKIEAESSEIVLPNTDVPDEERPGTPPNFIPSKVQQLRLICWRIKPWEYPKDKKLFHSLLGAGWGVDCDEVYPDLFIGDEASARNIKFLNKMGITHVLNTAEGVWTDCSFVNLTNDYYNGSGISYQGLQLWDHTCVRILPYLGCANEFIASGMSSGGRVLVNCQMGVSRSSTAAIAYMMLTKDWKVDDVLRLFRKRRDVRPNDFYLSQLIDLENDLRKFRECGVARKIKLHQLKDIDLLPKPWHYQFWESLPTDETLPFSLSCVCEPRSDMDSILRKPLLPSINRKCPFGRDCKAQNISIMKQQGEERMSYMKDQNIDKGLDSHIHKVKSSSCHQSKRDSRCSTTSNRTSSWEWEYYDDSDELDDDFDEIDKCSSVVDKTTDHGQLLGCFNDFKNES